jgi:GT2 family glycosyltransferase
VVESLNAGLAAAGGEVTVQLDADASVETPGWLERMVRALSTDERIGVVTGEVVIDTGKIQTCGVNVIGPEGFHDRPSLITERIGRRKWHFRVSRYDEGTRPEERSVAEVDSGIGCFMAYRRADALEAGGYDTGFSPLWFDDVDLCMSLRRLGKKAFFLPGLKVIHHYGISKGHDNLPRRAARRVRHLIPRSARVALVRGIGLDRPRAGTRDRFDHHHAYWERKWGWHPLNPDMDLIKRRYGGTEICWASEPELTEAGREIGARLAREVVQL